MKGFVDEVVILCGGEEIARHPRCYGAGEFVFDPLHYLALIETQAERARPGGAAAGLGSAARRSSTCAICWRRAWATAASASSSRSCGCWRALAEGGRGRRGHRGDPARRHRLRCGQADRAGADRAAAGPARPGRLSAICRRPTCGRPAAADYAVLLPGAGGMTAAATTRCRRERASGTPQVLLAHHLKQLKLPTVLREYDKVARECARDGVDHPRYLLRLVELELIDRERRMVERRIRAGPVPGGEEPRHASTSPPFPASTRCWSSSWPAASTSCAARTSSRSATRGTGKTPCRPGPWPCRLPEGLQRRLHHRRRAGPPADGGARREAACSSCSASCRRSSC